MKRSVYLHDIPLERAKQVFEDALRKVDLWGILGNEEIPLDENATGRVLAEPIWAKISSPHFNASAMDGFAIIAEDTEKALPSKPVTLKIGAQAWYVDTGDPIPPQANSVIPIEQVESINVHGNPAEDIRRPDSIRFREVVKPWSHIRPVGEDIVATQLVLPSGQVLRAFDLGAIASAGYSTVIVARKPRVTIIPTGSELVEPGSNLKPGELIEFNSIMLASQIKLWGGDARRYKIVKDFPDDIRTAVRKAAGESDLIILNAGSSAGSEDFTSQIVEEMGELLVHGVAVRPGHPVILGIIHNNGNTVVPMIGVPGYPVSAALTGEIFLEPLIAQWLGRQATKREDIEAILTKKTNSTSGDDDFVRVVVGEVDGRVLAAPIARGAGVISSLAKADGIMIIPRGIQGVGAGEKVKVELYRSKDELKKTILAIGSHDMTLDIAAQFLAEKNRRLTSANVGSQAGLIAIRKHEAHIAGTHLLDPETGSYNLTAIGDYLQGEQVVLIHWVEREQGLMVQRGNPLRIESLADLQGRKVRYVNRQKGAGTRVLLDYHIKKLGIEPNEIYGYDQEEYTHLSVASAVASGRADCGLGIAAAAKALYLDFIPLYQEEYDIITRASDYESELLLPFFDLCSDPVFKEMIMKMPGYRVDHMGEIVFRSG